MNKLQIKKGVVLLAGGIACVVLVIVMVVLLGLRPSSGGAQHFEVAPGENRLSVAARLQQQGIIRSRYHFVGASIVLGRSIQAGVYSLDAAKSPLVILRQMSSTDQTVKFTIPEGWRREQIAQSLTEKGFDGAQFLTLTKGKEGVLFPDTYFITPGTNAIQGLVKRMEDTFASKTASLELTKADIILASIVEREAKKDEERSVIAGIYAHRLAIGMKMDADPTVQFGRDTNLLAAGKAVDKFWGTITVADYQGVISEYNTYLSPGLPPTPIANAGIKSLEAAKNPTATTAIFFLHGKDGTLVTARTLEEHNANKRKYL